MLRFFAWRRSALYSSPACLRQPSIVSWSSLAIRTRSLFYAAAIPCSLPLGDNRPRIDASSYYEYYMKKIRRY